MHPTPATVVDLPRLEANVAATAATAAAAGAVLRPHAKTHKCAEVGRLQLAAGAVGLSVATLGEAEAFAAAGFGDLFVAYPLWLDDDRAGRLAALAERVRLTVGIDSAAGAERLAAAVPGLRVRVEVDCGQHRTGVPAQAAGALAVAAARSGLEVEGVFTFPGHGYEPGRQAAVARAEADALDEAATAVARAGLGVVLRSGGSTPTLAHPVPGAADELRPGVYVFQDAQQVRLGTCPADRVALSVIATVVSTTVAGQVVLDAGSKMLGADRPAWMPGHGFLPAWDGAVVTGLWEHHAVVRFAGARPALGERVAVVPNHVCTAVNLVDELLVTAGGTVVDRWPVIARGRT